MILDIDIINAKNKINSWWNKKKKDSPTEAVVGSTFVGTTSTVAGGLCIGNGFKRLADGENTYGGIGPILTIVSGVTFGLIGIKCISESIEAFNIIQKNKKKGEKKDE